MIHLAGMEKSFQIFHKQVFPAKMRNKINKLTAKINIMQEKSVKQQKKIKA